MTSSEMMRAARKAVAREDYPEAMALYGKLRRMPDQIDSLDTALRFAYCADQVGEIETAISTYREVIEIYRIREEIGAAEALEHIVANLQKRIDDSASADAESAAVEQPEVAPTVVAAVQPQPAAAPTSPAGTEDASALLLSVPELAAPTVTKSKVSPRPATPAPLALAVTPLNEQQLMQRLIGLGRKRVLRPGQLLCRAGDVAEHLWLLIKGELNVQLPDYEQTDKLEAIEGGHVLVGELGFFFRRRRSATVTTATVSELYEIDAELIWRIAFDDPPFYTGLDKLFRERVVEPILARHDVFERVNDIDRKRIALAFEEIKLKPGDVLIEQGEEHNGAYMVRTGCLFFQYQNEVPSEEKLAASDETLSSILSGDIVHLGGLLRGYKAEYRVKAATPTTVLRLSQEAFEPFTDKRPWIIPAILKYSRRPVHLQVMRPEDSYHWAMDRTVTLRPVSYRYD